MENISKDISVKKLEELLQTIEEAEEMENIPKDISVKKLEELLQTIEKAKELVQEIDSNEKICMIIIDM
ncbi:Hypothetical predicted protein [Octopus vulgaris]|uniref:Uncharacterized protein n=1 Tax=Octopus vulgaris TaxID=6645 RepID=A0AA36ARR2_OCTVU|nr:Hypothetical predicted protein [Octopus vulgaris]